MSKTIVKQSIEGSLGYCTNGTMGVIPHMSKTRSNQGSDNKWRDCYYVYKTIEKKGIERSLEYCSNRPIGASPPMSKTRSKQDIEGEWGDCSNMFKTIENQDSERTLGHGANGKMIIGKSGLKKGMTIYA